MANKTEKQANKEKQMDMARFIVSGIKDTGARRTALYAMQQFFGAEVPVDIPTLEKWGLNISELMEKKLGAMEIKLVLPQTLTMMIDNNGKLHLNFGGAQFKLETNKLGGAEGYISFKEIIVNEESGKLKEIETSGLYVHITQDDGTEINASVGGIEIGFEGRSFLQVSSLHELKILSVSELERIDIEDAELRYEKGETRMNYPAASYGVSKG